MFVLLQPTYFLLDHHETSHVNVKSSENDDSDGWHLVGTFKTTTADVKQYYIVPPNLNINNYVSSFFLGSFRKDDCFS